MTNKTGPVRAIRSYMGANSGPLTQRTHIFYQARQDIITNLRVHNIANIYDAFDYNSNASGTKYQNNLNTASVVINGTKDVVTLGDIKWELVSGGKGSLVILFNRTTDLAPSEATFTSYYDDNKTKPASNCTGDGQAWGTSGVGVLFNNGTVCTEPVKSSCAGTGYFRQLSLQRQIYFEAPNAALSVATNYSSQYNNPLQIIFSSCSSQPLYAYKNISQPSNIGLAQPQLFPNPAQSFTNLSYISEKVSTLEITIYNALGIAVQRKTVTSNEGNNLITLNTQNLPSGIYQVLLRDRLKQTKMKLIVL